MKPVAENFPSNQEDEELGVASKFLGALPCRRPYPINQLAVE